MPKYEVGIARTGYSYRTITVEAESEEEAEIIAQDTAGGYEFSESNAEYEVDAAVEVNN